MIREKQFRKTAIFKSLLNFQFCSTMLMPSYETYLFNYNLIYVAQYLASLEGSQFANYQIGEVIRQSTLLRLARKGHSCPYVSGKLMNLAQKHNL